MIEGAHDVDGTTYYACPECGTCPCPLHRYEMNDHAETCSHRVPDEWDFEDCAMFGSGKFMMCSRCQRPPCRAEIPEAVGVGQQCGKGGGHVVERGVDLSWLICPTCIRLKLSPTHWVMRATGVCRGRSTW